MSDMTKRINKVLKAVAAMEGNKSEVTIGNLREVYKCLAIYEAALIMDSINKAANDDTHPEDPCALTPEEIFEVWGGIEGPSFGVLREYKDMYLKKMIAKEYR